jgi:tRNA(Ile)-lysidine synthase
VSRSAQLCAEQEALLDELMQDQLSAVLASDGSLSIALLVEKSELMRARLIRMWLEQQGLRMPSRELLNKIWFEVARAKQDANPIVNLPDGQIRRFNSCLYVVKQQKDVSSWQQRVVLNQACELPDQLGSLLLQKSSKGVLSSHALSTAELRVHFNPEGLSAHPAERGHSRKLKKLFQEYQVPSWQRRRMPILMCDEKVVAVVGLFIDRHFVGQDCELIWDK